MTNSNNRQGITFSTIQKHLVVSLLLLPPSLTPFSHPSKGVIRPHPQMQSNQTGMSSFFLGINPSGTGNGSFFPCHCGLCGGVTYKVSPRIEKFDVFISISKHKDKNKNSFSNISANTCGKFEFSTPILSASLYNFFCFLLARSNCCKIRLLTLGLNKINLAIVRHLFVN